MLFLALQVLVLGIFVDETLGCFGAGCTGRSLLDSREVALFQTHFYMNTSK